MKRVRSVYALAAVALSLGGAPTLVAATPLMPVSRAGSLEGPSPEFRALRERGIALHDAARDGDGPAARRAVEPLERYLDRFANDGEARAWLGSVYAMMDAMPRASSTRCATPIAACATSTARWTRRRGASRCA